jgi:thiol-disulfide isomerase/thioredoxin
MPITSPTTGNLLQTPYPGAVTPTPFVTAALPTPGLATASPLPTISGSIVPSFTPPPSVTPGIVRTRIRATDPRSFEIVSGQRQLVEFFAYWSKTSQSMAPVIHALEDRYDERIRFVYLDIDDPQNNLFKSLIDDRLPPLFYLLDGQGNVLGEWQGIVPAAEFESAFANVQP